MALFKRKQKLTKDDYNKARIRDFLDLTLTSKLSARLDHLVTDSQLRAVWAFRMYPIKTDELALLGKIGEMENVTLRLDLRKCTDSEQESIINTAVNRANMRMSSSNKATEKTAAKADREEILEQGICDGSYEGHDHFPF